MSERKLRRSSNSSLNLRAQMNDNYVVVHDVSSNVAFEKYIQFARSSFDNAVRLYNKKDYQRAYVDFTKFQKFVEEKLPSHEGYQTERGEKATIWLMQATEAAVQFLDEISFQLDVIEDQKLHPDSRAGFMTELQQHVVDIYVPEWIDSDSDDEEEKMRTHAHHGHVPHQHVPFQAPLHGAEHQHSLHLQRPDLQHAHSAPVHLPHQQYQVPASPHYHSHGAPQHYEGAAAHAHSPRAPLHHSASVDYNGHPHAHPHSPMAAHPHSPMYQHSHAAAPGTPNNGLYNHNLHHAEQAPNRVPYVHHLPGLSPDDGAIMQYYRAFNT